MSDLSLKTIARLAGVAAFLGVALLLSGCDLDSYPQDLSYGLRTDPIYPDEMLKALNKNQPQEIDRPGVFPDIIQHIDSPEIKRILYPTELPADARQNLLASLTELFGSPANPTVSGIDADVQRALMVEPDRIMPRTGLPILVQGSQLYRQQCLHCHGLTGSGQGPTSPWVNPHPRDYRLGRFKFTSSSQDEGDRKPRREDLLRTLRMGIEGSSMPAFGVLAEDDLESMASYVIHLSIRGEVEASVITDLLNKEIKGDAAEVNERVQAYLQKIAGNWLTAEKKAIVPGPYPDLSTPERKKKSVQHGWQLFLSKGDAGCIGCHIDYGRQNNFTYDAWGTITRPANLTLGVYRGGRRPLDLYYRVHSGINGSGMTAFGKALKSEDIWDLVNFMQALPYPGMRKEYDINID